MRKGNVLPIALMAFALVGFLFVLEYSINDYRLPWSTNTTVKNTNNLACTQEAMLCSDGSYVGRSGPNCDFAACPSTTNTSTANTNSSSNKNVNTVTTTNSNTNTATTQPLKVVFVNGQTQALITNTSVNLYADNGVRCVTEPCPTNGRTMVDTTDAAGSMTVPVTFVDESMTFTLTGYQGKELHVGGTLQADGSWKLSLTPKT